MICLLINDPFLLINQRWSWWSMREEIKPIDSLFQKRWQLREPWFGYLSQHFREVSRSLSRLVPRLDLNVFQHTWCPISDWLNWSEDLNQCLILSWKGNKWIGRGRGGRSRISQHKEQWYPCIWQHNLSFLQWHQCRWRRRGRKGSRRWFLENERSLSPHCSVCDRRDIWRVGCWECWRGKCPDNGHKRSDTFLACSDC